MTLVRYNPLADFVPSTFGDFIENNLRESRKNHYTPKVDILKGEKEIELHLVAPGMSKDAFTIDLNENQLTISGDRKSIASDEKTFVSNETNYGKFSRSFNLNNEINKTNIKASYKDGILIVTLPLIEKKINKATIEVK